MTSASLIIVGATYARTRPKSLALRTKIAGLSLDFEIEAPTEKPALPSGDSDTGAPQP